MLKQLQTVSDPFHWQDAFGSLTVCKNRHQTSHLVVSILCHVAVIVYSRLKDGRHDVRFVPNLQDQLLKHYVVLWTSILTLPAGPQLDLWLVVMVLMDTWPLIYGIVNANRMGLMVNHHKDRNSVMLDRPGLQVINIYVTIEAIEEVCHTMRIWSPACRLNHVLMIVLDGCLFTHCSILFILTVAITSIHTYLFKAIYCVTT